MSQFGFTGHHLVQKHATVFVTLFLLRTLPGILMHLQSPLRLYYAALGWRRRIWSVELSLWLFVGWAKIVFKIQRKVKMLGSLIKSKNFKIAAVNNWFNDCGRWAVWYKLFVTCPLLALSTSPPLPFFSFLPPCFLPPTLPFFFNKTNIS